MTMGAIIALVLCVVAVIIFGIYAANHLEDDSHTDDSKNKNEPNHQ
ncbi:MAG: hypothetical protein K2Y14_09495 [Burkholderiales bacterium]|jgi:putative Ca2+/H+ antiporter (TMEM165/GDT1 family)|nr:hypothetical protein [Burkholderiales bacterium]